MRDAVAVPRADRPRVSILIPAFGADPFRRCLESLAVALADEPACEIIAVLNGPREELREVAAATEGLRSLDPPINLGFAAGLNLARSAAGGEYLVVVQDDTIVHPGWLEALVEVADAHPEAGIVCGVGLWPGGEPVQSAGVVIFPDCMARHVRDGTPVAELENLEPYAVDACSSAGMLVPARTWDAVGGLDEDFFPLYWVDATLAMRVWERGEAVLCAPQARVEHTRHLSTSVRFRMHVFARNLEKFRERWGTILDARHEPAADHGPEAMQRALERARIAWTHARPGPPPSKRAPAPYDLAGDDSGRLRAGLHFARRALETRRTFAEELEVSLDARETELRASKSDAVQLRSERDVAAQELRAAHEELHKLRLDLERARNEVPPETAAELAWLRQRSETLEAVVTGGWWRLRRRLLPLIHLGGRLCVRPFRRLRRRPVVIFLDHSGWDCFLQLAGALRRAGARAVCVRLEGGLRQYAISRAGYGTTLRADRPRHVRRLAALARRGRIIDVQLSEAAVALLGSSSPVTETLSSRSVPGVERRWELLDKLEVSRRLQRAGVAVPPVVEVEIGAPAEVVSELAGALGYPVLVKRRIDTAGSGVVIAADAAAAVAGAEQLGTAGAGIFLERFIAGEVVQYTAMVCADGVEHGSELCLQVEKAADNPLGPSVAVTVLDDEALLDAGRRVVAALGCTGLVNLEFMRDQDGAVHHIDFSARAFGNLATLSIAGPDLIDAYVRSLGLTTLRPTRTAGRRLAPGERLTVFPYGVIKSEGRGSTGQRVRRFISGSVPYRRRFGIRYWTTAALLEAWRARDRRAARQQASVEPSALA